MASRPTGSAGCRFPGDAPRPPSGQHFRPTEAERPILVHPLTARALSQAAVTQSAEGSVPSLRSLDQNAQAHSHGADRALPLPAPVTRAHSAHTPSQAHLWQRSLVLEGAAVPQAQSGAPRPWPRVPLRRPRGTAGPGQRVSCSQACPPSCRADSAAAPWARPGKPPPALSPQKC